MSVVFRPDHHGLAVAALKTGNDLHRALDRDELVLHYQPIMDLRTGRVLGFEALIRWNHPERGLLAPGGVHPVRRGDRASSSRWERGRSRPRAARPRTGRAFATA